MRSLVVLVPGVLGSRVAPVVVAAARVTAVVLLPELVAAPGADEETSAAG
jgi:hypothetical protein